MVESDKLYLEQLHKEIEEIRIELKKMKELIGKSPKKKKNGIKDIDSAVINEIAKKYSVSTRSVEYLKEELELYCKSTGKQYKDYIATLQNWVRRALEVGKIKKDVTPKIDYLAEYEKPVKEISEDQRKQLEELKKRILDKV